MDEYLEFEYHEEMASDPQVLKAMEWLRGSKYSQQKMEYLFTVIAFPDKEKLSPLRPSPDFYRQTGSFAYTKEVGLRTNRQQLTLDVPAYQHRLMEIKEISQILPPLKVESIEDSAYEREFFTNYAGAEGICFRPSH